MFASRQDPDSDSDSNLKPVLDSGFESLKKRIFDKLSEHRVVIFSLRILMRLFPEKFQGENLSF